MGVVREHSKATTAVLLTAYHGHGDRGARERVIEENLPLVHAIARRFSRSAEPIEDLVQVGAIGLIKAVDGYREDRGRDLGAYAVPTIVGELRHYLSHRQPPESGAAHRGGAVESLVDDRRLEAHGSEQALEQTEARALLRTGFRALSRRERRVVALRYYGDLSQERIAATVGLSQVQVSRILSASLAKMRAALQASSPSE